MFTTKVFEAGPLFAERRKREALLVLRSSNHRIRSSSNAGELGGAWMSAMSSSSDTSPSDGRRMNLCTSARVHTHTHMHEDTRAKRLPLCARPMVSRCSSQRPVADAGRSGSACERGVHGTTHRLGEPERGI